MISFLLSLIIIYLTAKIIGQEKKARWFKKRQQNGIFNRRGFLGETLHFGYPCTVEGFIVMMIMFIVIFGISYALIFKY